MKLRFIFAALILSVSGLPANSQGLALSGVGGAPSGANISFVQHTSKVCAAATTCALAFSSNNGASDFLLYVSSTNSGATGLLSPATDSNSNTITSGSGDLLNDTTQGAIRIECVNSSNSGANTVTAHTTSAINIHISVWEFSGMSATACTVDASNKGIQSATAQSISTSGATLHPTDLVFGVFYDFTNNSSLTVGSGYSSPNSEFTQGSAGQESNLSEGKTVSSTGTQDAKATCGSGTDRVLQIVAAFKSA